MSVASDTSQAQRVFQPFGAALTAWKSGRREILLSGPAGTGKSRLCLQKLHACAKAYPGMRGMIVRKTRASLTQTAMVTFENKVIREGDLGTSLHFRTQEQQYEYPNGSIIAVGGLDKPSKVMSSEYDIIYVQEATELNENDWESLTTRLRNGVMPFQQLIADCNPSSPTHWLKRRCDRGVTLMLESRHEDNPSVTPSYLATLNALTGVRYLRLRLGKWASADGVVYEQWDRGIHLVSKQQLEDWNLLLHSGALQVNKWIVRRVFASVDFGFKNPGIIQVWITDHDDRMFLVREVYQTGKTIDWWIVQAQRLQHEYGIELFVCDPSEPAYIAQFNAAGLNAMGAINDIAPGVNAVQARLKVARDGRPRLYIYEFSLQEIDSTREVAHEPYCLEQEIDAYVWPQEKNGQPVKEVPVKLNDHSMDAMRYAVMYVDSMNGGVEALDAETAEAISGWRGW